MNTKDMLLLQENYRRLVSQNQVARLRIDNPLFHAFCCWLYNMDGWSGNEMLGVIGNPHKWTDEFNEQFVPFHVCEMNRDKLITRDAYLAGFALGAGIIHPDAAQEALDATYKRCYQDGALADGVVDGRSYRENNDSESTVKVLRVQQESKLCKLMTADRVVDLGHLVGADGEPLSYPRPVGAPTKYIAPNADYARTFRDYAVLFPDCVKRVDATQPPPFGCAYFIEDDEDGQPRLLASNWDSSG